MISDIVYFFLDPTVSKTDVRKSVQWGAWGGGVVLLSVLPLFYNSPYILHLLILTFIYIIATLSMRAILISGQFPLAHGAFMGVGAYAAGMASRWLGWPPWITLPIGAVSAMALGVLTGYPFARLRGLYYAMGSLFFGIGIINVITSCGYYTGSYAGLLGIHPLFGYSKEPYYYFFLALTVLIALALYRFEFSRIGTTLKAVTQSHLVAASVGINEGFYRILAVGVGCFFVGLAGAGYALYNQAVCPSSFNFLATLWLAMYVLVGGIDSFSGPIVGTFALFLLPEAFRNLKYYSPYISAAILLIVVYLMPKGLVSLPRILQNLLKPKSQEGKA